MFSSALALSAALFLGAAPQPPELPLKEINAIFVALDDEDFDVREEASKKLASLPRYKVDKHCRRLLKNAAASAEQKKRVRKLVTQWQRDDEAWAAREFDRMFPLPDDVPEIDGAWYTQGGYNFRKATCLAMVHWYDTTCHIHPRLASVQYSKYRTALWRWGVAQLARGADPRRVKEAVLWIRKRDDVFLGRTKATSEQWKVLESEPPPAILLVKIYP